MNDVQALLHEARRRLMRVQIEEHRLKAVMARLEAITEDVAAERLSKLLADHSDDRDLAAALSSQLEGYADDPAFSKSIFSPAAELLPARTSVADIGQDVSDTSKPSPLIVEKKPAATRTSPPGRVRASAPRPRATAHAKQTKSKAAARPRRPAKWPITPPWVTSSLAHGILFLVLGLFTMAAINEPQPTLMATIGQPSETYVAELPEEEITPVELEVPPADPLPLEPLFSDLEAAPPLQLADRTAVPPTTEAGEVASADLPIGAETAVETGAGDDEEGQGAGGGEGPAASFFGAEARASRIVFVVDNSNSMDEGRFETALLELARSVDALAPVQSFYVVFYSDTAYRLFHPQPVDGLVPATRENKALLREWLGTVEMCTGGRLVDAFEIVADLEPEVVYLLSDGVMGEYPISYLTEQRRWDFAIHTIGMTVPDRDALQNLLAIAQANRGVFRPVGVTPLARELARRRPVKKNRTRGPIWGVKLP